jgi:rubredoxin
VNAAVDKHPAERIPDMNNYQCPDCEYTYDEAKGDAHEGYPPGTRFASLPEDFVCPDCAVRYKEDFLQLEPAESA